MTFSTWNPSDKDAFIDLTFGNRTASPGVGITTFAGVRATNSRTTTGLYYFEVQLSSFGFTDFAVGVADNTVDLALKLDDQPGCWVLNGLGEVWANGVLVNTYTALSGAGCYVGVAVDLANGYIWFMVDGALVNGGSLPLVAGNRDDDTVAGAVFPIFSTTLTGPSAIGAWFEDDIVLGVGLPSGFDDWDEGSLVTTVVEAAVATETMSIAGGGTYHHTETNTSDATGEASGYRLIVFTQTSAAVVTDTDIGYRIGFAGSVANATATATGSKHATFIHVETANAYALIPATTYTTTVVEAAIATDTDSSYRIGFSGSVGNATATATGTRTHTAFLIDAIVAVDTDLPARVVTVVEAAVATATFKSIHTMSVVSNAAATATVGGLGTTSTVTVVETANATDTDSGRATMHMTIVEMADAEAFVRLPGSSVPNFWFNTMTGAAATWDGLPFNSLIDIDGRVVGATETGIAELTIGADDNGTEVSSQVLWDLLDFDVPNKKRCTHVYVDGNARSPFTVSVATREKRTYRYKTRRSGTDKAVQHLAYPGQGIESVYFRIGVEQTHDFDAGTVLVEHEVVRGRV